MTTSLSTTNRAKQDAIALDLKASTGRWVQKPCSGDYWRLSLDHNQPQYRYYRSLVPIPRSDRLGGGGDGCNYCDGDATALHLGKTSKSIRDSLEATTETIGLE